MCAVNSCGKYNKSWACPPGCGSLEENRAKTAQYKWGIIVHAASKPVSQKISLKLESKAFHDGYYMAFSMSDCGLCKVCAGMEGCSECRHPDKARPAFHSVGIDVFKTAHDLGMEIVTLADRDEQPQNWYSAVWVE